MSTTQPFDDLRAALNLWQEEFQELQITLENDRPASDSAALVGQIEDDVVEAMGLLQRAQVHAAAARDHRVAHHQRETVEALGDAHAALVELLGFLGTRLASFHRLQHVASIPAERGRAWSGWSRVVQRSLVACPEASMRTFQALGHAWRDVALPSTPTDCVPVFQTINRRN